MRILDIARHYQRRPAITLNNPCGSDTDYSAMPALAVNHHAIGVAQNHVFGKPLFDSVYDAAFLFLPFAVQLVEAAGDFAGAPHFFDAEDPDASFSNLHPSPRIYSPHA